MYLMEHWSGTKEVGPGIELETTAQFIASDISIAKPLCILN